MHAVLLSTHDAIHILNACIHRVHDFDQNATPQQKKEQALKAIGGKLPKRITDRHEGGTGTVQETVLAERGSW